MNWWHALRRWYHNRMAARAAFKLGQLHYKQLEEIEFLKRYQQGEQKYWTEVYAKHYSVEIFYRLRGESHGSKESTSESTAQNR